MGFKGVWRRGAIVAGALVFGSVGGVAAGATPESAQPEQRQSVNWQACPSYSDDTLRALFGADTERIAQFKQLWARTDCGTVSVPLDYADPLGSAGTSRPSRRRSRSGRHSPPA